MATVLTAIAPTLFSAAQNVSAEPAALINSIYMDFDNKGVASGDTVKVPVVPAQAAGEFTPAAVTSAGTGGGTAEAVSITISKNRKVSHVLTGEQMASLENGGNYQEWTRQWAEQAMRTLRNEVEADIAVAMKAGASRAYGTAGTTPFAASLDDLANVRKILRDNGAPMSDLQFVGNTSTELNLLKLGVVQQAYAAGSDEERRSGIIGKQLGFMMRTSNGIAYHTSAAGADYVTDTAGDTQPIGDTSFVLDTGSTAIAAGDIFSIADAGDYKYVVKTGAANAGATPITINKPGLRQAAAANKLLTFVGSYTPNFAFERSAVVGVVRPPIMPSNPTIRTMPISDGKGLTYMFAELDQYGQKSWEIILCWGFAVVQPEHVAILIG